MKKLELKQIIKEEVRKVLKERFGGIPILPTRTTIDFKNPNKNIFYKEWGKHPDNENVYYVLKGGMDYGKDNTILVSSAGKLNQSLDVGERNSFIHDQSRANLGNFKTIDIIDHEDIPKHSNKYHILKLYVFK